MNFEIELIEFLQAGRNAFFDASFQAISIIGSAVGVIALCIFFLIFNKKMLFWYLFSYGFVYLSVSTIKNLVARPRPFNVSENIANIGDIVQEFAFPSGHTACATAIAIFLGYFLWQHFKKKINSCVYCAELCNLCWFGMFVKNVFGQTLPYRCFGGCLDKHNYLCFGLSAYEFVKEKEGK